MDERVTPLWDGSAGSDESPAPLRRPNSVSTPNSRNSTRSQNLQDSRQSLELSGSANNSCAEDILSKSNLSVDAQEWFPPNYNKNPRPDLNNSSSSTKSVQDRLRKYKQTDTAAGDGQMHGFPQPLHEDLMMEETEHDLSKLEIMIDDLIDDPGQFGALIGTFIETLGPYYEDVNVVTITTHIIFNKALAEPNFRYNAARLCNTIEEQCPLFRSALHLLCEQRIKENVYDASLALFLAELHAQLSRDNFYGRFVIQTLQAVVSLGDGNNIKAVCQALKLTGASLETHNKVAINGIFDRLNVVKQSLPSAVVNLINSVIALRDSNWGQSQNSPTSTNNRHQPQEPETPHDGPIFYGPDGKELTEEERQFLADGCSYQNDFINDDSDPDGLWDPDPEMDAEMQAAFQQFVRLSK